jgi:multidrug efflux pump subunit AcrA (membrane-fusion protein)
MRRPTPEAPFLDADPPPVIVRALADLLALGFVVMLVLSVAVRLPVTVAGRFALTPVRGADPVRAPRAGVVVEAPLLEGRVVEKGQTLFRIRSEIAGDRAGEAATLEISARGAEARLGNERARHESQAAADRDQRRGLERRAVALGVEIELAEKKVGLARRLVEHWRRVYEERLGSFDDVQAREVEVTRSEMELARLRSEQDQARSAAERLRHQMEAQERAIVELERELREEAERARVRLSTLRSAPLPSLGNELSIAAPCAGTVVRLHVRASSAVVGEGDPLCDLVCAGEELRAEISVVDSGMGLIAPGQQVKLFYDAFPYQRHGVRYGTVRWIGPSGAVKPDAPAFRVLTQLSDREFRVRGAPYPLLPGMTGRAEIIVAEQSALVFALEPVRALREHLDRGP